MKVYYGLTNYSQLKHMPENINAMVSARMLMKMSPKSVAFNYCQRYERLFLDSGAFGSAMFDGGYTYTPDQYFQLVTRVQPNLWATMDFPCEPDIMPELSTDDRIRLSIENTQYFGKLDYPGFLPVIQGWEIEDYLKCVELMETKGVLRDYLGIGSICRRGSQAKIVAIVSELRKRLPDTRLHAFGVKINALSYNGGELMNYLHSLDTAAWQFKMERSIERRPKRVHDYPKLFEQYSKALKEKITGPYQLVFTNK